jgi:uncharacterized protein YjlB
MQSQVPLSPERLAELTNPAKPEATLLKDDGTIPNNPTLPLLVYHQVLKLPHDDPASRIEELVNTNKWSGCWRNGIYPYHHYHSTAHEVLLVYRGSATVQLGGEGGLTQKIEAGDVVVIPAGVGHKNLEHTDDFAVVGAYPQGQHWDMCYGKASERPRADKNIAQVPLPTTDPVFGSQGPLLQHWK